VSSVLTIAGYGLREALRRKVFGVVLILTVGFLTLFWLGVHFLYSNLGNVGPPAGVEARTFVGATVFGLAMFGTLFLGTVLAVFLTLGVVRGDAERGLLQPLVVRPIGRSTLLLARWLGAVAVCAPYVGIVYVGSMLIVGLTGHWWPDHLVVPGVELAAAVALIAGISILGSVFLTSTANGIAVLLNSHLLSEIELVCDRVAILLHGKLVEEGSPAELARPRGVEIETDEGTRLFEGAGRGDTPRLVAELVAAGRKVYGVRVLTSTLEDTYLEAVGGESS